MGSASKAASAASRSALARATALSFDQADELFTAERIIEGSSMLLGLLSDSAVAGDTKRAALTAVFGKTLSGEALSLVTEVVSHRWSSDDDLLAGLEDLGLRAMAASAPEGVDLIAEIFGFSAAVASSPELELALGSKLTPASAKAELVSRLLSGKVSESTLAIVRHLVQVPRGRRVHALVADATSTIADASGAVVATVTTAHALDAAQQERLAASLAATRGHAVRIHSRVDPALIGGVRVQIGNDIIDGSVATKIHDLRLQLAGA